MHQVGYYPELLRDARSTKCKILSLHVLTAALICYDVTNPNTLFRNCKSGNAQTWTRNKKFKNRETNYYKLSMRDFID